MKILRVLALVSFVIGLGLLVAGFFWSRGGDGEDDEPAVFDPIQATATPTPENTPAATPTPTPVPYDGAVVRLQIPRFDVDSGIEVIGITPENEMDVPKDPYNTGWYGLEGWGKPGFGDNSVFSAHVDYYPNILGPFHKLSKLELNDDIVVVMDNGLEYRYRVIRKARYSVSEIKMGELIWPPEKPENVEWVTLITCGGEFVSSQPGGPGEYLHRDVVVAERYQ